MGYRKAEEVFINGKCLKDILNSNENGIDLKNVDLSYIDLSSIDLSNANLSHANLEGVYLETANLSGANLSSANLKGASLRYVNLSYTNLRDADLRYVNLLGANLNNADLKGVNLFGASLGNANLNNVDLSYANLTDTNLLGAKLENVTYNDLTNFYNLQCPEKGSFIGYKLAKGNRVIELLITEDAKRSSGTSRICRCSKAKVLSITSIDGNVNYEEAVSEYDERFVYKVGEIVEVNNFDEDRWKVNTTGIHFFITRDEAIRYVYL